MQRDSGRHARARHPQPPHRMARQRCTWGLRALLWPLLACLLLSPPALGRTRRPATSASATSDRGPWATESSFGQMPSQGRHEALASGVPMVYQELGASGELISERLDQNQSSTPAPGAGPLRAQAAAAGVGGGTAGVRAAAAGGKLLIPLSAVISLCLSQAGGSLTISADNFLPGKWRGWGTSLAWFGYYIGEFPDDNLNLLLDLLFSKTTGLGLNIVRYNIGGGFNPSISKQFLNRTDPYRFRGMPGFKPMENGPYDWDSDAAQRDVLLGARDRGADTFVAFSNSPPWWMTISGDVAGHWKKNVCNLKPKYFDAFAQYLADVVLEYKTNPDWGIEFQYLEPFNEPLEGFWWKGKKHEGCYFNPAQIASVVGLAVSALARRGLSTQVVAIDSAAYQTGGCIARLPASTISSIESFHVHSYIYAPTADHAAATAKAYKPMGQVAQQLGKEVWLSEWGPVGCVGDDIDIALCMARQVIESVYLMNARAWVYWQAIDLFPLWALINIPWSADYSAPFSYSLSKKYHIVKQFSRSVPPGSVVVSIPGGEACTHSIAAFYYAEGKRLVVFVLNELKSSITTTLNFDRFVQSVGGRPAIRPYVTSTTVSLDYKGKTLRRRGQMGPFTYKYEARSLTRVIFTNVATS